jgi:hypothetical protein
MNAPALQLELPSDKYIETYANVDLTETMKVFEQYGLKFLNPEEIRAVMPEYPVR